MKIEILVKNMHKLLWYVAGFMFLVLPQFVFGTTHSGTGVNSGGATSSGAQPVSPLKNPISAGSAEGFIGAIVEIIRDLGFLVVIFFIIYSGFLFVKAQGNESELENAKKTLFWTIVGAAILLGAKPLADAIEATIQSFR